MVDDAARLGELLKLPNLEEDTITLINLKIREFIGGAKPMSNEQLDMKKDEMKKFFDEYLYGVQQGG